MLKQPCERGKNSRRSRRIFVKCYDNSVAATLYLVDGMSHIYRAYHAIQGLSNKEGLPTNAVFGFTNMLRKLIADEKPDYLGVAIDVAGPTVRHEQYEDYKATRRPMPDDLNQQIPYILQVCEVLNVPVVSYERYEADDVIGTLAHQARERDLEVVIVTIDKDMFQLVGDHVTVLDTRSMTRLDPSKVTQKFGVPPEKVVDVLSLVGDSSDNIPGARGIGAKGARQLISEYGSLDQLLTCRDQVKRKTYRESLEENEDLIRQSRELVTIHEDLPLELDLDDLKISVPNEEEARKLFGELDFTSLLEEFLPILQVVETSFSEIQTAKELATLASSIQGEKAGLALLHSSEDGSVSILRAMAVAAGEEKAWCITGEFLEKKGGAVGKLLNRAQQWMVHDLKPLYFLARQYDWVLEDNIQDTMLMAYLLNPNQNSFSLAKLSLEYLRYKVHDFDGPTESLLEKGMTNSSCEKAHATLQLAEVLYPEIEEQGLVRVLTDIETPLVQVLAHMEEQGVKVDTDLLNRMSSEMEQEIERLTREIYEVAGQEFNINSPRQLSAILFEELDLPAPKKTRKAGHYATGVGVLEELAAEHGIAQLILDYRELTKLKSTYLDALPRLVSPRTGRIHTSYNQMVAATGRLSSSSPNLQNIPIKGELGRQIRRAFVPEAGYQILAADYSQIELRVMAHLSQDPVLLDAFRKDEDIHERTAREVFGMQAMMEPKEYRRHAKVINFGIMYGLSAFGLARNLKIDRQEAQRFIDDYFRKYQGIKAWIDRTLAEVHEKGHVKTLFGRMRPIPEIHSKNWNLRSFAERTAINAPIQGTAADLIKKAMISIDRDIARQKLASRLILQVHDELVVEVEDSEVEELKLLVRERMEGVANLLVPLKVDLAVGDSWFDAK